MGTLLLRRAQALATFDDDGRELRDADVFIRDGVIVSVGPATDEPCAADDVVDCSALVLTPGLVNTHHHFFQTLTRAVPGTQDAGLFDWLTRLYPIWARLGPEAVRTATTTAIAELVRSGCTTAADHGYIWPNGARLDDQIEAARAFGFRFHAARGSMSVGRSRGGLPPDAIVEDEAAILADTQRVIETYHDPARFALTRIVVAPCSPFSVSEDLMRESIALARSAGVHAHTHLAETLDEEQFCRERYGCRPVELAERLGWTGPDVWHAHLVHPSPAECVRLGAAATGVAHCPTSNMRLGSGIAPLAALAAAGARVGLGVDGSASNDGSNLLDEARHALLVQRIRPAVGAAEAATWFSARDVLRFATRGGASVLGRDDIGIIAPGMAADIAGWRTDALELAGGAVHDPLAALVFCRPVHTDLTVIAGRILVRNGSFTTFDCAAHVREHNRIASALVSA